MAKKIAKQKIQKTNVKKTKCSCSKWRALFGGIVWFVLGAVVGGACFSYFSYQSMVSEIYECVDGGAVDKNGCCPGEVFTDTTNNGPVCCPETGGDCFPPIR